jgi:hypothetical protein
MGCTFHRHHLQIVAAAAAWGISLMLGWLQQVHSSCTLCNLCCCLSSHIRLTWLLLLLLLLLLQRHPAAHFVLCTALSAPGCSC